MKINSTTDFESPAHSFRDTQIAENIPTQPGHLLKLDNITKQYPGTLALNQVNFDVHAGEVHVLFGENGAGKSTLIQIVAGVIQPSSGQLFLNGEELKIYSVHHARELGISAVFQEFSLIPQLTVEENLFLGSEVLFGPFIKKKLLHKRACETLDRLGFDLPPEKKVMHLTRAEQQMVEIAKAFRTKPSIMILDEPTASLTEQEADRLFAMIEILKEEGIGIIYITHRTNEIHRIGDRITILRDGQYVTTVGVAETSEEKLVELTVGRQINQIFPDINIRPGRSVLNIENLTLVNQVVRDISINVRAGEIVGVAGLVGSGKSELGRASFGLNKIQSGSISYLDDKVFDSEKRINEISPRAMLDRGMLYLPSDRRLEGLIMMQNIRENVSLSSLKLPKFSSGFLLHRKSEIDIVSEVAQRLGLNPSNIENLLEHLSGGNQQKVLVAKSLVRDVKLFILDQPTVGIDIGARVEIYQLIRDVCEAGAGVLLISSDLSEIVNLSHRAYVLHRGKLKTELTQEELSEQAILKNFLDQPNPET
jgi:ribose transport system ATP-binding protein